MAFLIGVEMLFCKTCLILYPVIGHLVFTNVSEESREVGMLNTVKGVTTLPYPV